ncbi:class I SAM-dependent methyltransferase [Helicobacter sp. 23-1044]
MKCILCESQNLSLLERIKASDLIALYAKMGVSVRHILTQDVEYVHCKNCDLRFFRLQNGEIPTGDDDFYTELIKNSWYYLAEKNEYDFARKFIKNGARVLEVGCGAGVFGKSLQGVADYVGLEFSTKAKELASQNGVNIQNILVQDFAKQNDSEFSVACSFQVLEHTANPREFLEAQISCLMPNRGGGRIS